MFVKVFNTQPLVLYNYTFPDLFEGKNTLFSPQLWHLAMYPGGMLDIPPYLVLQQMFPVQMTIKGLVD